MNPVMQKIDSWQRHKKATSTFHHINNHYPGDFNQEKANSKDDHLNKNFHKRAKSFSRDSYKYNAHYELLMQKMNQKHSNEFNSQIFKEMKKANRQKSLKDKKIDFLRDYIKSESQSRNKKRKSASKIELKIAKSTPDNKMQQKSSKRLKPNKEYANVKQRPDFEQKRKQKKQYSKQKTSKDSKVSKSSNTKKSDHLKNIKKANHRRQIQNELHRDNKAAHINFKNMNLKKKQSKSQIYPMTPQQAAEKFFDFLNQTEINEMKQYKYIYFLGRNFEEKQKKNINSARQSRLKQQNQQIQKKNYYLNQTENVPCQKKLQSDPDDTSQFYQYSIGQHIAYRYQIVSSINRGSFGQVLKVLDHKTKQFVAIKVVKKSKELVQQTFVEISILTHIKQNDKGNTSGIVRIKDFLLFRNHICIIFELLDGNLYQLLTANGFKGFNEEVIRLFAVQILNSLNFLRKQKIIHCDLKPENLVMKNWGKSGIKLIDFGTSCYQGKQMYSYLQSRYYRAPQVFMQMPYSYPIDMWSFGCMMAQFKIGDALFTGRSSIQQLVYIVSCIGLPNKSDGLFSLAFLQNEKMKQLLQYEYLNNEGQNGLYFGQNSFLQNHEVKLKKECLLTLEQRLSKRQSVNPHFLDFLQKILVWQPDKRLTPEEALRHPWITKGLSPEIYSLYSSFNTSESCSRQKKNSKDSKGSKTSRQKSSRQKSKKVHKMEIFQTENKVYQKSKGENKINFAQKKLSQQLTFLQKNSKQSLQAQTESKKPKLKPFIYKKQPDTLHPSN